MNDSDEVDVSFNDSTNFDEDSISSLIAESESQRNNWRGWKSSSLMDLFTFNEKLGKVLPLVELAAKSVASFIPFEVVENVNPPIPEQLHLRITFWSFPENEEDIRLYSCLENGNSNEFEKADSLVKNNKVKNMLQIGFHLSASVQDLTMVSYEVSLTFDRRCIVSCNCSCLTNSKWCCHIIAVCLNRILDPSSVKLRAPVSESLSKLQRDQLQKFAQYLITELPQQILPTAQRLLDDLLLNKESRINALRGAPDPTAGASALEKTNWCLDLNHLHENIKKTLLKLRMPAPIVYSDVIFLNANAPQASTEWTSFLRPLRGKEPEGMWNLISIVKKLMKKNDGNSVVLLTVITEELLECKEIIIWWFKTKHSKFFNNNCFRSTNNSNNPSEKNSYHQNNLSSSQQASSLLCDEVVLLWRLTCLNPSLNVVEKQKYLQLLKDWHIYIMTTIYENCREDESVINESIKNPGFEPAIKACSIDWDDYPIPGITFSHAIKSSDNDINNLIHSVNSVNISVDLDSSQQPTCSKNLSVDSNINVNKNNEPNINLSINNSSINSIVNNHNENLDNINSNNKSINDSSNSNNLSESSNEKTNNENNIIDEELNSLYKFSINMFDDEYLKSNNQLSQKYKNKLDPIEIQLARAEALFAYGHNKYACELVIQLAENMLKHPPKVEFGLDHLNLKPGHQKNDNKSTSSNSSKLKLVQLQFDNAFNQKPILQASDVYNKITFICNVLIDNQICLDLAFKIGILGLELARPPSSVKALEVKLFNQEQDLIPILKKIPLNESEMDLLRLKAKKICNGELKTRGSLLPLMLASFIFDALVISKTDPQKAKLVVKHKLPIDKFLGFECAVTAISLKCPLPEKEYYLIWEGIRRQRSEFVVNLLYYYRDEENRLVRIMEKLITDNNSNNYTSVHACDLDKKNSDSNSDELKEYEKKYENCKCTLKILSSKIYTGNNCIYTNNLIQPGKTRYKEKKHNAKLNKAHFMFELAKSVLTKAGGNTSPSLFTNPTDDVISTKPNRRLHICAFQLGLYALGLLNSGSMKWLQRTYSTHVSWISAQAMDIGHPAINFLIDTWKGHLVPSETAALADRASRSRDNSMVLAAGKLAVSCLTESQTLRLNEIRRAIVQCKEIDEEMLIQALISVESSLKKGGLSSDILFEIARNWHTLYEEHSSKEPEDKREIINYIPNTDYHPSFFYPSFVLTLPPPYAHNIPRHRLSHHNNNHTTKQHHHFNPSQNSQLNCNNYNIFNSHFPYPIYNGPPSSSQLYEETLSQALKQGVPYFDQYPFFNMPPPPVFPIPQIRSNFDQNYMRTNLINNNTKMLQFNYPFNVQNKKNQPKLVSFLFNAFRLGIIALQSLPRKEIEDKALTAKFDLNPPYHDDIVWLANVSSKLTPKHQLEFLTQVNKIVSSPFILYDLIMIIEKKFTNVTLFKRTFNLFTQLISNATYTFEECIRYKLYHLSQPDYEEFAKIVLKAKQIYSKLQDGEKSFQSKLDTIKKSCSDCVLWNYVNEVLKNWDNNKEVT